MVLSRSVPGVNFYNDDTPVRLNPGTLIAFEDEKMVILSHPLSDQSIRIQYDILLVLYPMIHWSTVGAICVTWPPDDQAKIKSHLTMLYAGKIVVTDETEVYQVATAEDLQTSVLPEEMGKQIQINIENHFFMLRDTMRMACYRRAIEQAVTPESVVLDLGSGSGILSFFAARAGAKQVYAIERRSDMVMLATQLAQTNGFDSQITFIESMSQTVDPSQLTPQPNLLVAEILGNAILEENVLEFTIDARDRLLAPGAKLIPAGLDIVLFAYDAGLMPDKAAEVDEIAEIYGFDFSLLKTVLSQKARLSCERFVPSQYPIMSDAVSVISLDLTTIQSAKFDQAFTITVKQDGFINGFCAYFKAHLDAETMLTNSPWAPQTHWTQLCFLFPDRRAVKAGETLAMQLKYDGGLLLWYTD